MQELPTILATVGSVVGILATAALVFERLGFKFVQRPAVQAKESNGNGWHRCPFYSTHIERSKRTSGALHISEEALGKIEDLRHELKDANYLTEGSHDRICRANLSELKGEIRDMLDNRFKEFEEKIIAAVKG